MSTEAQRVLQRARERAKRREATAAPPPDYANANRVFRRQKAALTRAVNSGDPEKVALACRKAVREWSQPPFNGCWPDDWSRWQRALDDVLPWNQHIDLSDLR